MSGPLADVFELYAGRGGVDILVAVRAWKENGSQYVFVVHPDTGAQWPRCPVGGSRAIAIGAPDVLWDGQMRTGVYPYVLVGYRGQSMPPIVLDRQGNETWKYAGDDTVSDEYHANEEKPVDTRTVGVNDSAMAHAGSQFIQTEEGKTVIAPGKDLETQLPEGGVSRVVDSSGGTTERLVPSGPANQRFNDIVNVINQILAVLNVGGVTVTPVPVKVQFAGLPSPMSPMVIQEIQSALFHISSTTVG